MRLATATDGNRADDLAIGVRFRVDIDRHKLVEFIAEALFAKRPDMKIGFLPFDERSRVRRQAGFVRPRHRNGKSKDGD